MLIKNSEDNLLSNWQAFDLLLDKMKKDGFPFDKVAGVSGAGQVSMIHKNSGINYYTKQVWIHKHTSLIDLHVWFTNTGTTLKN